MLRTSVVWATLLAAGGALAIPANASAEEWVPPPRTTSAPPTQSRRVDASGWQLAGAVTMAAGAGIGWLGFIGCLSGKGTSGGKTSAAGTTKQRVAAAIQRKHGKKPA